MIPRRIPDEERSRIPDKHKCEVSYNGYHAWEILEDREVLCTKCLEQRLLEEIERD